MPPRKKTIEQIKKASLKLGFVCSSRIYKSSKHKLTFTCSNGHKFRSSWYKLCRFKTCPKCIRGYQERFVRKVVEKLFNRKFEKVRPDWLKYITGRNLELDMYNNDLAFEYNGIQHEKVIKRFGGTKKKLISQKERDQFKSNKCKELGITLIVVPQLWDILDPFLIKEYIKQKIIESKYPLPDNFENIDIDVEAFLNEARKMQ